MTVRLQTVQNVKRCDDRKKIQTRQAKHRVRICPQNVRVLLVAGVNWVKNSSFWLILVVAPPKACKTAKVSQKEGLQVLYCRPRYRSGINRYAKTIPSDVVGDIRSPAIGDNQPVNVESLRLEGGQTDVGKQLLYLPPWRILWMEGQV